MIRKVVIISFNVLLSYIIKKKKKKNPNRLYWIGLMFWYDNWSVFDTFVVLFFSLFEFDKQNFCFVYERLSNTGFNWAWKKINLHQVKVSKLNRLFGLIFSIHLSGSPDSWKSKLSRDGVFHVNDLRTLINLKVTRSFNNPMVWVHLVPSKVGCFGWRACLNPFQLGWRLLRGDWMCRTHLVNYAATVMTILIMF